MNSHLNVHVRPKSSDSTTGECSKHAYYDCPCYSSGSFTLPNNSLQFCLYKYG